MPQDRRISLIGGLILLAANLAAGIAVYTVMERQTESVLSRSLQTALQSNVHLLESQTNQALKDARTVATRPFLVQTLQILEATPDDAAAIIAMQRAATSFLPTGFDGLSFYDASGREVARAGRSSRRGERHVSLNKKDRAFLLWNDKFIVQSQLDILDPKGVRVGQVMAETSLPLLSRVFADLAPIGQSAEFVLCAPLEDGDKDMDCFLSRVSGMDFKRMPRVVNGAALPMDYALRKGSGIIVAKDYRHQEVVAAYVPVPSFGLGTVLKIDQDELYAPIYAQLRYILPLLAMLAIIGMVLLNFLVTPVVRRLVRSERSVRESEVQLRQITDAMPAWITFIDADQRFRFHNRAYEETMGLKAAQIDGKTLPEVMGQAFYESILPRVEQALSGYPVVYERVQAIPGGGSRDFVVNYFPRYGEGANEGKVLGFYALGSDITELKRIDRMKSEFVSTVSHELRTPLTSIRGSLGLIAGGVAGQLPEAAKTLVSIATNNCERLIRLINDILDIEKIESGKMKLDLQVLELGPLMAQVLAANEGFGAAHNVSLKLFVPPEALQVQADSDRLIQVVTNLLSNAVKFSPPGGVVEVHVSRAGIGLRVEVRDRGPGIPEEFRKRIFQKFSQADSSDSRQAAGTGLGLNISRAIVERMNGRIGFDSQAGVGTTFFFELPEWQDLPSLNSGAHSLSRPKVLVCEDDPDIARLIGMMLDKGGFDSNTAYSAAQAQAMLAQNRYAAMTVDLKLPDEDGVTLIRVLRGQAATRNLPIVVVSAIAGEGQIACNNLPLNVSDWLHKPIDDNLMIMSLRLAIDRMASGMPRILYVEDDLDLQRITAAIAQDFAVFEFAGSVQEARKRLTEQRFDLVLLDLAFPEGSGWDLLVDIEALDRPAPVVVFSATPVSQTDQARVAAVLMKSRTSNAELMQTLHQVLDQAQSAAVRLPL